jgi:UDP-N-acetylmuramyl pentapeptide phosphotransferase/UDP-N-acetylglucosamine-1-phosphate transferase
VSIEWAVAAALPALISWAVIEGLRRSRHAARLADVPNDRSLHFAPRPRIGGIGVMAGALPVACVFGDTAIHVLLACAAALTLVSLADDVQSLPIEVRLPAHVAAALVAVLTVGAPAGTHPGLAAVEAAVAVAAIVWMTNLFNFMDGSDGLAGGMAAIGFLALAIAACFAGMAPLALAAAAVASASAGFLAQNFPPARVFLGDAGSVPLGFLGGALGLHGVVADAWAWWFPVLVFSPFIVDATATLLRRAVKRERFWTGHRTHAYQRLVLAGWSQRRLALAAYGLMLAAASSALVARVSGPPAQFGIILVWAAGYLLLFIAIERRIRAA